ncbi:ArdC family protein [Dyadobacter bucti]|uniref:ArdC family protein n=1 Tax=Dyadobacter bucti TaxID=2572203 RepID=UPI001108C56E|nr:zincin-like metallopeptidase domain-containing protein [Dyadobacter bucti]
MNTSIKKTTKRSAKQKEAKLTNEGQSQNDIYSRVTNKILSDLEKGNLTWRKPWNSEYLSGYVMRPLRFNNVPYTGINTLMLWGTAAEKGYALPHWMTFKQALAMKGCVRKDEKGTQVVYADTLIKEHEEEGDTKISKIPYLKCYIVFNVSQIEGLPEAFYKLPQPSKANPEQRSKEIGDFFAQTKADIYVGSQASYSQSTDKIQMPPFESFETAAGYYGTLAHELTHWTKHPKRLNRDLGRKHYGDEGYAEEELVAELGACFLAADLGFEPMPEQQHAAYIQSWLKVLKDNKRFIFFAASHAQKAAEYIHGQQSRQNCVPA